MKQKIIPNLWFDGNAQEAVDFYISVFPESQIRATSYYPNSTEEGLADFQVDLAGEVLSIDFELRQHPFIAINAGPEFKINPSISFMVNFDPSRDDQAWEHLDELWQKLSDGGQTLMPLEAYPFSERYGWIKDRYDVTWQLILTDPGAEPRPFIIPSLLFTQKNNNHAEEAINFYTSVFNESKLGNLFHYVEEHGPANKGALQFGDFMLANQWFVAMDSAVEQEFTFNEAVSLMVNCQDQAEIDYYWDKLSSNPKFEQCGWCKDRYGLSWQIVPENMEELMEKPDAFAHLMVMKKIIITDF